MQAFLEKGRLHLTEKAIHKGEEVESLTWKE